jgi:hypothetical protein
MSPLGTNCCYNILCNHEMNFLEFGLDSRNLKLFYFFVVVGRPRRRFLTLENFVAPTVFMFLFRPPTQRETYMYTHTGHF